MARTDKRYTKTPTYVDVNGVVREGMTQQEYEDNRINSMNDLAKEYLAYRDYVVDNKTGKTAQQLYDEGIALMNSPKFLEMSPERQQAMVDLLEGERKKLWYDFFWGEDSLWNRWDNLSRAWVNRNNFAQRFGYKDWGDLYGSAQNNPTQLPKSIYDHSTTSNQTNPLAWLTQAQLNALAFQAAAGTEFKDQNDLAWVINQINEWNGWGSDWKPINTWNQWWNNTSSNTSNNWIQRSTNTPTQQSNGWRWITGNQGSSALDPLATGTGSGWTAQDGGYGDMGGSNISFKQVWNNIPHIVQTQWWLNAERNIDKFKNFSL